MHFEQGQLCAILKRFPSNQRHERGDTGALRPNGDEGDTGRQGPCGSGDLQTFQLFYNFMELR